MSVSPHNSLIAATLPCNCLDPFPGKAVEDGPKPWDSAPMWETWEKLVANGFGSAQLWPLQPLRNEPMDGRSLFLSLLFANKSPFPIKANLFF